MAENASVERLDKPWTRPYEEILGAFEVEPDSGLDSQEVRRRRKRFGRNRLRRAERKSTWAVLLEQFKSLIVGLLAVAAAVSFAFGDVVEGIAILAVIIINAGLGFAMELRAVRSMEALRELGTVDAKVRREGSVTVVPAEELVPGDMVVLEGGDVVTADMRVIEANKLQVNESALTGESVPVSKQLEPVDEETPLAERASMVFKGTAVTRGSGEGVIVATGMETELGRISELVEEAEEEVTPLEERLQGLGRRLIWVVLIIGAFVAAAGVAAGRDLFLMIETGIALAVASIPEGLPIVATIALARGMWRMARRNALVNRLSSVETLGSTTVILTDKTGTLTENQMTATRYALATGEYQVTGEGLDTEGEFRHDGQAMDLGGQAILRQALKVGVLCNNAELDQSDSEMNAIGEPLEVALLVAGAKAGLEYDTLVDEEPEVREVAFDPDVKMMATYHESDGRYRVAVKGALEAVLEASTRIETEDDTQELDEEDRKRWMARNEEMASKGLRMLALATRWVDDPEAEPYEDLTFLGLVGLLDPPREDVRPAIQKSQDAGVRVVMVTGDQPETARTVALAVGLVDKEDAAVVRGRELEDPAELDEEERRAMLETPIFARVNPEQKLQLIQLHQDSGAVVAMTGDGVNDAPALKKADIGVAMGERGTQVAREAADMVLLDDAFSSIVAAIEQGRVIFDNIRKFVLYLLSCNISEILVVSLATMADLPLPVRPLQILFLNLVTDVFPALALGVGRGDERVMDRPPRDPGESIMTRRYWWGVAGYGGLITIAVLASLVLALNVFDMMTDRAVTVSFMTLALAQLWHVFNMRDFGSRLLNNEITRNPYVWGAVGLSIGLVLVAVYVPGLANLLEVANPGTEGWCLVLGMSLVPLLIGQIVHQVWPMIQRED